MDDQNSDSSNNPAPSEPDNQLPVSGLGSPPNDNIVSPAVPLTPPPPVNASDNAGTPAPDSSDQLMGIKQRAITELAPLVKHLDQTPEERFKTTLMMIQVSDNKDLIKDAYEAAEQITDQKAKAQALLDIVNEINYFTTQA